MLHICLYYTLLQPPDPTPDGHRAPVAELLCTTRSVDTQTPAVEELLPYLSLQEEVKEQEEGRYCSSGGSNSSPCSVSPVDSRYAFMSTNADSSCVIKYRIVKFL